MNFIWFCFIAYGLTQILVYGSIFDPYRPKEGKLGKLFSCPMCMGFWVGIFLWLFRDFTTLITFDSSVVTGLFCGFVSSGVSYALSVIFGDDGFKLEKKVHIYRRKPVRRLHK